LLLGDEPRLENIDVGAARFRRHSVRTMTTPAPIDIIFIIRGQRLLASRRSRTQWIACSAAPSRTAFDERSDDSCAPRTVSVRV
jgi:hypothetical protein